MAADSGKGRAAWLWALLGVGTLWAIASASHAAAGGVTAADPLDQIREMTAWLHKKLTDAGFQTVPWYETADSATEEIVDPTGGRNLVQRNQTVTDAFHAFMWDSNAALKFKNFNPATDTERFQKMLDNYTYLQSALTPEFLA